MKLNDNKVVVIDPHIKIMNSPIRMIKGWGQMTVFRERDAEFDIVMAVLQSNLVSVSKISFKNVYA